MNLKRETSAGYMTNWAARLFARELERQLAPTGIAPAYMPVIFALSDGSTLTQKELTRRAAVEQPTMAATLKRMERDGMITRATDPDDRRSALIQLTALALSKVDDVKRVVSAINALALEQLTPEERAQYLGLLARVVSVLEAQDDSYAAQ
jgi:MarR family transcriptional regulator for hemolysin